MSTQITPRILRYRDAPGYLGMDRTKFDTEVRPAVTEIPIGQRGIGFDRIELDAWIEAYITSRGRPGRNTGKGAISCEPEQKVSYSPPMGVGQLTKSTRGEGFIRGSVQSVRTMPKRGLETDKLKSTPMSAFDKAVSACGLMQRESI